MANSRLVTLLQILVLALIAAAAFAGPRPCDVRAQPLQDAPAVGARLLSAKDVPIGHYAKTGQDATGIVIGQGSPPADAQDQTPTVQLLVLDPGRGGTAAGEVTNLGGMEIVIDLGPVPLPQ